MTRRRSTNTLLNPVLLGAITVLVLIAGLLFAYTANVGLPFVPVRTLHVDIADGSDLTKGNDVLEGGYRIGFVSSMKPIRLPTGAPAAQLTLSLETSHGKIPVDSTATVLSRSVLGLKYVNLTIGHSHRVFADKGTMPITQTKVQVSYNQLLSVYTPKTRTGIQEDLVGFGNALAGRGAALNDTFAALPALLRELAPVTTYLSQPRTGFTAFITSLDGLTHTLGPQTGQLVSFFHNMGTTWQAISADPRALQQGIAESPATLAVGTASLRAQRPFLANLTILGHELTPAATALGNALPAVNGTIHAGTRTLRQTPPLDSELQRVMVSLEKLSNDPSTGVAINALTDTVNTLNPAIQYLGPYVTVCNDWNYWWTNLAGDLDEETDFGYAQRALFNQGNPAQPNNVSGQGATGPANGGGFTTPLAGGNEYAHAPAYGAAVDAQGNADCENGQRGYPLKLNYNDPQGRNLDTDQHTPGDQGTTFTGTAHVPAGETFLRTPSDAPTAPVVPGNG
jgi:virulence factor Mce-like protein